MKVKLLGKPNTTVNRAVARAKAARADKTGKEVFAECLIIYKDGVATIIPMQSYSVGVAMPNPVPYRGVSIGVGNKGVPYYTSSSVNTNYTVGAVSYARYDITYSIFNSYGILQATITGYSITGYSSPGATVVYMEWHNIITNRPNDSASNWYAIYQASPAVQWPLFSGTSTGATAPITPYSYSTVSPSYESLLAADIAAGTGGTLTYVMASDGTTLASEVQNTANGHTYYVPDAAWNGGSYVNMTIDSTDGAFGHQLTFTVPEDCIYPAPTVRDARYTRLQRPTAGLSTANPYLIYDVTIYDASGGVVSSFVETIYYWGGWTFNYGGGYAPNGTPIGITYTSSGIDGSAPYMAPLKPTSPSWTVCSGTVSGVTQGSGWTPAWAGGGWSGVSPSYESLTGKPSTNLTAFNLRRRLWFKKNSDEFMAALKAGFAAGAAGVTRAELQTGALPTYWDNQIKREVNSMHWALPSTYMPIAMSITSAADVVVSDTSAGKTQTGTKVTKRTTTFAYTDATGKVWSSVIDGYLTEACTKPTLLNGTPAAITYNRATYSNWYASAETELQTSPPNVNYLKHQYVQDRYGDGVGLLWNGVHQWGNRTDSTWFGWDNPLSAAAYVPPIPAESNTLVGTAPDIYLQYHNTVLPKYDATGVLASTVMNNSALYGVTSVSLRLFGPVKADGTQLGMFADPSDADGCTSFAYYGKATFSFSWKTGAFTFVSWASKQILDKNGKPVLDALGSPTYPVTALPKGVSYWGAGGSLSFTGLTDPYGVAHANVDAYNVVVSYNYAGASEWPDVAVTVAADKTAMAATLAYAQNGTKPASTITPPVPFGDPVRALVLSL